MASGTAALLLEQRPGLTPDQVKALLMGTAKPLASAGAVAQGKGLVDLARARTAATPSAVQSYERSTGTGSLEKARGTAHVDINGSKRTGEVDFTGRAWTTDGFTRGTGAAVAKGNLNGLSRNGLSWNGLSWR